MTHRSAKHITIPKQDSSRINVLINLNLRALSLHFKTHTPIPIEKAHQIFQFRSCRWSCSRQSGFQRKLIDFSAFCERCAFGTDHSALQLFQLLAQSLNFVNSTTCETKALLPWHCPYCWMTPGTCWMKVPQAKHGTQRRFILKNVILGPWAIDGEVLQSVVTLMALEGTCIFLSFLSHGVAVGVSVPDPDRGKDAFSSFQNECNLQPSVNHVFVTSNSRPFGYFPLDEAQVANISLDLSDSFALRDPARWCMPSALQSLRFPWLWGWLLDMNSTHHRFSKSWLPASLMPSCIWNLSSSEVPVELWPSAAGRHPGEVMWCKELPFWMVWLIASIWLFTLLHPQLNSNQPGKESPWTYFTTRGKAVPKGMANHAFNTI